MSDLKQDWVCKGAEPPNLKGSNPLLVGLLIVVGLVSMVRQVNRLIDFRQQKQINRGAITPEKLCCTGTPPARQFFFRYFSAHFTNRYSVGSTCSEECITSIRNTKFGYVGQNVCCNSWTSIQFENLYESSNMTVYHKVTRKTCFIYFYINKPNET